MLTQIRSLHCYVMHAVDRNVHYAVSQELNPSHTLTVEDGQCHLFSSAHALASCLHMARRENVEKWFSLDATCTWWQELDGYLCLVANLLRMSHRRIQNALLLEKKCFPGPVKCELLHTTNNLGNVCISINIFYPFKLVNKLLFVLYILVLNFGVTLVILEVKIDRRQYA